jgi:hypothetical protein
VRARVKARLEDDHLAAGGQTVRKEMAREEEASGHESKACAACAAQGAKKDARQTDGSGQGHRLNKPCAV